MRISCIGAGVLGQSWIALFLAQGFRVRAFDPAEGWVDAVRAEVEDAAETLKALGYENVGDMTNFSAAGSLEEAVRDADFVQESAPENLEIKQKLLADIEASAPAEAIIASSTSGLLPSELCERLKNPARFVVAHPFDPPHIIPLVEIVGSPQVDPECIKKVEALFKELKKAPLVMQREVPGFIGNRLQSAIGREAFHMIAAGEATMAEIDFAICNGPGLRWPETGPCEGEIEWVAPKGLTHIDRERYEASMKSDWSRLKGPDLTPEFEKVLLQQFEARRADPKPLWDLGVKSRVLDVMRVVGLIK